MTPTALLPKEADYRTACSITTTSLKLSPSFSFHISLALGWVQKPKRAKKKKKKHTSKGSCMGLKRGAGTRGWQMSQSNSQDPGHRHSSSAPLPQTHSSRPGTLRAEPDRPEATRQPSEPPNRGDLAGKKRCFHTRSVLWSPTAKALSRPGLSALSLA